MMSLTKLIIVVDADCDVHDYPEVAWRAFGNVDYSPRPVGASRARSTTSTTPPTSSSGAARSGIDATRKLPEEGYTRDGGWPEMVTSDPATAALVTGAGRSTDCERASHGQACAAKRVPSERGGRMSATADAFEAPPNTAKAFLRLVLIEHSVFALPFAYIAALTAMFLADKRVHWGELLIVTIAMVGARTFAMAVNRIIDREIDARNPRTAKPRTGHRRGLAAHRVHRRRRSRSRSSSPRRRCSTRSAWRWRRSRWCRWWSTRTASGSPTSRTRCSASPRRSGPIGAWMAVTGSWSWTAVVLGLAVGFWIGGFDLIYALPGRRRRPRRGRALGAGPLRRRRRAATARAAATSSPPACCSGSACSPTPGRRSWSAWSWWSRRVPATSTRIVKPNDLSRLNRAFFTTNGFVGISLFVFALLDLILRGLRIG